MTPMFHSKMHENRYYKIKRREQNLFILRVIVQSIIVGVTAFVLTLIILEIFK